jgi:NAD(P)-dependent dehydrogenase (short-subunit alcohol dehydrogenase family)
MRFTNKVCLITGAGSGIGRATATQMAKEGGKIVVIDHEEKGGIETCQQIVKAGGQAIFIRTNVAHAAEVEASVNKSVKQWGKIDVVINNAAMMTFEKITDLPVEKWDQLMNINLRAVFLYTKYCVPHMVPGSAFVNISSVHAHETTPNVIPYASSKGGMEVFVKGACLEYAELGIRFNCVAPGSVDTPMLRENPNVKSGVEQLTGPIGQPEELAEAICFMASPQASFVNGTTLIVDGGKLEALG